MIDVVIHRLGQLRKEGYEPEAVAILQPTSPLRRARHIDEAVAELERSGADTVVSVVEVPHRFSPYNVLERQGHWLSDFWKGKTPFDRLRRQELPKLYARNGPVVLVCRVGPLLARRSFYSGKVAPYPMGAWESIDIDTAEDLRWAELLLAQEEAAR